MIWYSLWAPLMTNLTSPSQSLYVGLWIASKVCSAKIKISVNLVIHLAAEVRNLGTIHDLPASLNTHMHPKWQSQLFPPQE